VVVPSGREALEASVARVIGYLEEQALLPAPEVLR